MLVVTVEAVLLVVMCQWCCCCLGKAFSRCGNDGGSVCYWLWCVGVDAVSLKPSPNAFTRPTYTINRLRGDLYDLYGVARVTPWEPYELYDLASTSRVGHVLYIYRSCTTSYDGRCSICCRWSR